MDYSNTATETDQLVGASPWGSSSPNLSRTAPYSPPRPEPDSPSHGPSHSYNRSADSADEAVASTSRGGGPPQQSSDSQDPFTQQGTQPQIGGPNAHHQGQYGAPAGEQQQQRPGAARYHSARQQRPVPQYKLQAKITALERQGRKDPVLRFDVYTNLPKFRTTQFRDVRRTHGEFQKLADHLISSNPEAFIPAVPPATTSAGAGTEEDEARVKASLQRWLNYVCSNDVLMRDEEMVFFVESDFGYSPVVRMKQPATGVRRKVLKQFAPPPDDTPELLSARPVVKQFYLNSLDAAQKLDKVVKARRSLGLAETTLGEKLTQMQVQEPHIGLSNAYRKLGRITQTVGDYHPAQGTAEATTLGDSLNYHSSDAFIVKETLTNRHILLRELLQAQTLRQSKENSVTRLKASTTVRRDKVDEAMSALDEAASQETYLRGKTQRVTGNLLLEKRRWFDRTSADLISSVREYVLRQIEAERRSLATLESVRADIRAIDASGGLSRLGRENHPTRQRISMASSQGVKGDAWSGVPRTRDALSRSLSGSGLLGVPAAVPGAGGGEVGEDAVNGADAGGLGISGNGGAATGGGRPRSATGTGSLASVKEDEDEDRVDARNAASRLAQSTF